ncbi:slit homolog 1 protein [Cephus cinctus]|uniref:Slit homolog 1 protein n=1 Tax=Cephus cinctus TaxID=211228 RepID=A0AAJ7CG98_CEPCN|nr:slit homolog 1 protein [Cephus cinctus]
MTIFWILFVLGVVTCGGAGFENFQLTIDNGILRSVRKTGQTDELDLSNCGIKEIHPEAFREVNVKTLNLTGNLLTNLPGGIFENLKDLEYLFLDRNNISSVDGAFSGLNNLKLLNFSQNKIKVMNGGEFYGIPKTSEILIKNNSLWTISTRIFENPLSLKIEKIKDEDSNNSDCQQDTFCYLESETFLQKIGIAFNRTAGPSQEIKLCIFNGTLETVENLEKDEIPNEGCKRITVHPIEGRLNLQGYNITSFALNWFKIHNLGIYQIDLSNNAIEEITQELLNDLPKDVALVNLGHNRIKQIKYKTIKNEFIKFLYFHANFIENIENGSFGATKLYGLYLSQNKLVDLSFISSLPDTMEELYLSQNQILYIPDGIFQNQGKLNLLNLAKNDIVGIQDNAFRGLISLKNLKLAFNKITRLEAGFSKDLVKLKTLDCNDNFISVIEKNSLKDARNLRDLLLVRNKITGYEKDSLAELPKSLIFLNLNENLLEILDSYTFSSVPGLQILLLEGNRISDIRPGALRNLNNLTLLNISKNPLKQLNNGSLFGLSINPPTSLYIHDNVLEQIQGGIFDDL